MALEGVPMKSHEINQLLEATRDKNPKIRKSALLQLCPCHVRANHEEIWDRLFEIQTDSDSGVRSVVLHNLCDGSPREREDEVVAAVERLANDRDRKLRRRARNALASYRRTGIINVERFACRWASRSIVRSRPGAS